MHRAPADMQHARVAAAICGDVAARLEVARDMLRNAETATSGLQILRHCTALGDAATAYRCGRCAARSACVGLQTAHEFYDAAIGKGHLRAAYRRAQPIICNIKHYDDSDVLFAEKLLKQAHEGGVTKATVLLAQLYDKGGPGIAADAGAAMDLFLVAAVQGHADSALRVGTALLKGRGIANDVVRGFQFIKSAAENHNAEALYRMSKCLASGVGCSWDMEAAYTALGRACNLQFPKAMVRMANQLLADMHPTSNGDPRWSILGLEPCDCFHDQIRSSANEYDMRALRDSDFSVEEGDEPYVRKTRETNAIRLLRCAVDERGYKPAASRLGQVLKRYRMSENDLLDAYLFSDGAFERGEHYLAAYTLGAMYLKGLYLSQCVETAVRMFKLSADAGNCDARFRLGIIFLDGFESVQPDHDAAVIYLKGALECTGTKLERARLALARILSNTGSKLCDLPAALSLLRDAERGGSAEACMRLGRAYAIGELGLPVSLPGAERMFRLAENRGHAAARDELRQITALRSAAKRTADAAQHAEAPAKRVVAVVACPVCREAAPTLSFDCGHALCASCDAALVRRVCPCCRAELRYKRRLHLGFVDADV